MEKCLKDGYRIGNSVLAFGGTVITEDSRGRRVPHSCGLFWNPWDELARTVAALNSFSIEGNPGPKVSIKVFAVSLRDRKILEELKPTFANSAKEIWVWEYEVPVAVFINGTSDATETWTVSHWKMLSGRVVFDLAKNKIQLETKVQPKIETTVKDNDNGNGDEFSQKEKDDIAKAQANALKPDGKKPKGKDHRPPEPHEIRADN